MNKQQLIDAVLANTVIKTTASRAQVATVIDTLGDIVGRELAYKKGDREVTLPGIGKLKVAKRAAREGRNPKTGEAMKIKAKTVVKFSAAKVLKDAVA